MKTRIPTRFAKLSLCLFAACLTLPLVASAASKKVLVVTVTTGFRHTEGIDASEKILPRIAEQSGAFTLDWCRQPAGKPNVPRKPAAPKADADAAAKEKYQRELAKWEEDSAKVKAAEAAYQEALEKEMAKLSPENLKNYDAVIFNNTTGDLPLPDKEGFLKWIQEGGGFMGIHAATDTYHGFRPFIEMIGGEFATHGAQATVDIINQDPQHPACKHITTPWTVHDEIYLVKNFERSKVHGLLTLDKHPNNKTPGDYPIAWCKQYGKGRVLYSSLGHRADVWDDDPNMKRQNPPAVAKAHQQHILSSIRWVAGLD